MTAITYSMSFTTAPLLFHETLLVAELFAREQEWQPVREKVLNENLLQMRTVNSSKRIFSELSSRLKQLTPVQLSQFADSKTTFANSGTKAV